METGQAAEPGGRKMNEQFYDLPQEKQLRIINAGLEVFSRNDYRHSSTEEIARKAEISKGLLFYYFHNKKSLYLFLFDYCAKLIVNQVVDEQFEEITDFFELMEYAAEAKVKLLMKTPYLADFVVRAFYSEDEAVTQDLNQSSSLLATGIFQEYFKRIDYSSFRPDVTPREIYDMLVWMTEGFIHEKQRTGKSVDIGEIMDKFYLWERRLRQIAYKEEYQRGNSEGNLWEKQEELREK